MITHNQQELNNFLTSIVKIERTRIFKFLSNNPEILVVNLAEEKK